MNANIWEVCMSKASLRRTVSLLMLLAVAVSPTAVLAQTRVVAPNNPYSEAKDVELGRQASQQAERQLPLLNDQGVQAYVERVGRRLVEAIPAEFQHPQFRYTFKVLDLRDLNAFALPGGFTYVNRGLIEAAHNEGELAGAMAHEISHVALRHGTAQAAKARKYQVGAAAVGILGTIFGGPGLGQLGQAGVGAYFLKFSREYEKQADILGSHIMANAGYDPHDLANIFRTLEQQGGSGGPQWLSDHPNPGNRFEYISREAEALHVIDPTRNTDQFIQAQALLRDMPRARSMQEISRSRQRYPQQGDQRYPSQDDQRYPQQGDQRYPSQDDQRYPQQRDQRYPPQDDQRYPPQDDQRNPQQRDQRYPQQGRRQQVEYPSSRFRNYSESAFRISVPDNWRELPAGDNVTFAPEGAYRETQGQFVFTHGIQVGTVRSQSRSLKNATDELIGGLTKENQGLQKRGGYQRESLGRRDAISVSLTNVSEITGRPEVVTVYTTMLRSGDLFYVIAVAPEDQIQDYQRTFMAVVGTVALND
jgi:Zn-dependent protease with chaperone function